MSDPVSSMDVEDVLSSIRRLVSEEAKGSGSTGESASEIASADLHEAAEEAASGPLSDIVQAVEDGADGGSAYNAGTPPSNDEIDDRGVSLSLDDDLEDGQVAFRHKARGSLRKDSEDKLVLTAAFRVAESVEEMTDAPADVGASLDESDEDTQNHPHLRPVEDTVDDDAASGSGGSAGSGADMLRQLAGSPDDTLFDRARQAMEAVRESNPDRTSVAQTSVETEAEEIDEPEAAAIAEPSDTVSISPLRRKVEVSQPEETAIEDGQEDAPSDEAVEPPSASSFASPFSAQGGAFDRSSEVAKEDEIEEASTINFTEEDSSMLDEDSLRDLVSDMVREELQGELGDRITRNVRKLVRREIQRALASREFE
jgi:hypothetical protein